MRGPARAALRNDRARRHTRRSSARNIASVRCRCGQSWTVPGSGPAQSGTSGSSGARVLEATSSRAPSSAGDHVAGLGEHRRAGGVEDHAARADRVERRGRAAPAGAGPASRGRRGVRRQRDSGRRRRAPSPVHGASTSTRSKLPGRHGGRVPSAGDAPPATPASAGERAAHQPGPVRLHARWRSGGRRAAAASAASSAALPPGPAQRSSHRSSRPSTAAPRPGPARPAGSPRPGRRRAPRPRRGRRPGRPRPAPRRRASRASARPAAPRGRPVRAARPGPPRGGSLSAASSASSCLAAPVAPSAAASSSTTQRGWLKATTAKPSGSATGSGATRDPARRGRARRPGAAPR